ncbi:acetolactate synthase small subunit [Thermanaerovibrio acidaminovorans]|jgi:acetolactate synthase-1/3 small subunit|uniref:Acetolactate synthase small subunit n=1 Tax=Thermanaerovibrio acidaminovorans (strain ATCC 49978 / DSM 6589 / Su883) TaxID=525903 RepID=D1B737_THEAS|nr:acetolactate synthase small subunit [Thermanaerovibrio acidaminovorans]ACZ19828.1 acetolactate synthase, small subunit [Thermanaerovibrio acidaminovorans DSM 6589]
MTRTLSILAEDHPGVLMRIAGLIFRRGYNIRSLSVGHTHLDGISRFTIVVDADRRDIAPLMGQLSKLVEVLEVLELRGDRMVERRIALVKVACPVDMRDQILRIGQVFHCRVVDLGQEAVTFEVTGEPQKIEACVKAMRPYGILEVASSGSVGMTRADLDVAEESVPHLVLAC